MLNKRTGLLPFIKIDQYSDWQLSGYYKNVPLTLKNVPKDKLVGFKTPLVAYSLADAPATMTIRRIDIKDNLITVLSSKVVTSGLVKYAYTLNGLPYSYYYRNQGVYSADPNDYLTDGCLYDIYIIDSQNNEFISEPFLAITDIATSSTKPIYKRNGFLPFYKSDQSQDWKLNGYFKNWVLSLKKISKTSLVSFRTPLIDGSFTEPTSFTLRHLMVIDDTVSVIDSQTISTTIAKDFELIGSTVYSYYYWNQSDIGIILNEGCIYDITISDGTNNFQSDIFLAVDESNREYWLVTEDNVQILTEDGKYVNIDL
jgi:hypothetical protein